MTSAQPEHIQPELEEQGLEKGFNWLIKTMDKVFLGQWLQRYVKPGSRNNFVDFYVIVKVILAFVFVSLGAYKLCGFWVLPLYLTLETVNYNCFHIFQDRNFKNKKSLTRNILLGILNYLEIVFNFAFFYAASGSIKKTTVFEPGKVLNFLDYIYFSVVTGTTVGYGDLIAVGNTGHFLVISQILTFILFFTIFITYNLSLFINNANT